MFIAGIQTVRDKRTAYKGRVYFDDRLASRNLGLQFLLQLGNLLQGAAHRTDDSARA